MRVRLRRRHPMLVIVSLDSFEHFAEPGDVLQTMYSLLEPGGCVFVSFGPNWYRPLGGHLFSVFPWADIGRPDSLARSIQDRRSQEVW